MSESKTCPREPTREMLTVPIENEWWPHLTRGMIWRAMYDAAPQDDLPQRINLENSPLEGGPLLALADAAVAKMTPNARALVARLVQADQQQKRSSQRSQPFLADRCYALGKAEGATQTAAPQDDLPSLRAENERLRAALDNVHTVAEGYEKRLQVAEPAVERLRAALRDVAIVVEDDFGPENPDLNRTTCNLCECTWRTDGPEQHASGCLAEKR